MSAEWTDDEGFRALTEKIARDRGFGCASYKDGCLRRRIAVRMRASGTTDYGDYAALLDRDRAEYDRLLDALTINVTRLFRDAPVWEAFAETFLPPLWEGSPTRFTAWSAGCASGEELYTLAAILHAHAERTRTVSRLARTTIIGSDIDRGSLAAAERGVYPAEAFAETPPAMLARYFSPDAPHAAVPELRALVRVERRDLLSEPAPALGLQLVSCRNMLIYIDRVSQEPLVRRFHEALAPGGILILGKVETLLGPVRALFETVDQRSRIFRRSAER
ncbi:MAG: protein-glutamate O-methyltransferase CheR [Gemmatimonadaceae bacterium]